MSNMPVTEKLATDSQGRCFIKIAREKKVPRTVIQKALNNGSIARYLDSLVADEKCGYTPMSTSHIRRLTTLAKQEGARILVLRRVRVTQDLDWQDAINLVGSDTPHDSPIRMVRVGALFPPVSDSEVEIDIVLLNYPKGDGDWDKALMWADKASMNITNPREVFAIGTHNPSLHVFLGQDQIHVVASTEATCINQRISASVWSDDLRRGASVIYPSDCKSSSIWHAFRQ